MLAPFSNCHSPARCEFPLPLFAGGNSMSNRRGENGRYSIHRPSVARHGCRGKRADFSIGDRSPGQRIPILRLWNNGKGCLPILQRETGCKRKCPIFANKALQLTERSKTFCIARRDYLSPLCLSCMV